MITVTSMEESQITAAAALEARCFTDGVSEASLRSFVRAESNHYGAALTDGMLCGYGGFSLAADEAEILTVAVAAEFRRQGIGRMLTEWMLAEAAALGARTMYLEVRESNEAARALYAALGFTQIGVRKNYYVRPRENAILMMRPL